ncbi:thiol reductant ABC exporter subunit CydD [Pontibacillus yanchengensis]|uniref:Thiol reductant ABC exporter subunit CydD n=1 Tax=Pontibacillus yanchengensis TaxID=462910 RepID=A0ACC7VLU3_9BACI|nr:thiol reductant ABC exporter subunit CydD [Pontibacillus yanchengensis]MYL54984.1 thiol reductant ABC exporter subunit CydD [Pontibacillus yanchengensis]
MNDLKKLAKEQKGSRIWLIVSSSGLALSVIAQAYLIVKIVDLVFLQQALFEKIIPLAVWLAIALLARVGFTYFNGWIGVKMATTMKRKFREKLFEKFSSNPLQASIAGQSGHKVSVTMDSVDELDSYFSKYAPQVIQSTIVPLSILIVVAIQHFPSAVIMMVTAPFIPLFYAIIGIMTKKKSEEQMDKMAIFSGHFLDTLQGLTTLKLFGRSNQKKESIEQSSLDFRDATMEVLKVAFVSSLMLELISMLSIGIIALEIGLQLVVFENITFVPAFFILVLAPEFYLALKDLGSAFHTGRGSMGAANKVNEELQQDIQPVNWGNKPLHHLTEPPHIMLDHVGYQYEEDEFELHPVTAEIPAYKQIAIVGKTGAGKTTLLHLLAGLLPPTSGELKVNDASLNEYQEEEWLGQISYISQHPYIFSGTLAENIALGSKKDVTRNEIEEAGQQAGISGFVNGLAQGYDTIVGEGGRGLSGGEKQRVALARAFLKKPSFIIFDEPTTGLDLFTEQILQQSIQTLSKQATMVTVAHRLHTIRQADEIWVMEQGTIVAKGTHEELLQTTSVYQDMVDVQKRSVTL